MVKTRGIRLPLDLQDEVTAAAITNERSFSAEIRYLVKLGLERRNRDMASGQARELQSFMQQAQP